MSLRRRDMIVSDFRAESRGGMSRASANVNGIQLWFESRDIELTAAPEAFGSALLLASQHRQRRLIIENAVDRTWAENVAMVAAKWAIWWRYKPLLPDAETTETTGESRARTTALCFSGGVDSFFSLVTGPRPDFLVAVHGFDISLRDALRMSGLERTLLQAAESVGAKPVRIRTNLRDHPANGRRRLWERSHGGALAAIGHVLKRRVTHLSISSTYSIAHDRPWGSSVHTDPLFSSSDLQIVHFGTAPREEKIRAILTHPMVRTHLRVCWENRNPEGNCSRCAKCLLVMLHLAEYGVLHEFVVFEGKDELSDRIDALPYVTTHIAVMQRAIQRGELEPRLREAAARLVRRSLRAATWHKWRTYAGNMADRYV